MFQKSCWHYCFLMDYLDSIMQIKDGFGDGKDLVVSVMSAMEKSRSVALRTLAPSNCPS